MYVISQFLVIIAYIYCGLGFLKKEKIDILKYSTLFSIIISIHYLLLNAYTGLIACIINIVQNILFSYNIKKNKKNTKAELILLCVMTIIATIIFYKSIYDFFPMILILISNIAYWKDNTKFLRVSNIICSICYIIYAISIKSFMTILCETYLIINTCIGIFRHEKIF